MATVAITCSLIGFHYYKMDAECKEKQRDYISRREKRWSMNSQRLEEIVAELMKPIGDVRRSFDTDLSALLEEYLTEAGLRALEAGEGEDEDEEGAGAGAGPLLDGAPNFAELALLLQQSASIYGRKVDFLYQHVLTVSDSLHNNSIEDSPGAAAGAGGGGARRKRRSSAQGAGGFAAIALERCAGSAREPGAPRPPPTLPRLYLELEPRALAPGDAPLADYAGEPVGLLEDFHVAWRLRRGLLVERLGAADAGAGPRPRAVPLPQLQAAIEAAAPPPIESPPDESPPTPPPPSPPPPTSPPPIAPEVLAVAIAAARRRRKRKWETGAELLAATTFNLSISEEGARALRRRRDFGADGAWAARGEWAARVLLRRRARLLRLRAHAAAGERLLRRGFCGWSAAEAARAAEEARDAAARLQGSAGGGAGGCDSDDDGFFERSSLGDSDTSRADDSLLHTPCAATATARVTATAGAEWAMWREGVPAGAAGTAGTAGAAGPDVRALAGRVLAALPDAPAPPRLFTAVLREACAAPADVSQLFLATLFLANAGAVELAPGAPLALGELRVRAVSRDPRLHGAAADLFAADLRAADLHAADLHAAAS